MPSSPYKSTTTDYKLLLHTCCADCAIKAITSLEKMGFQKQEILLYFDNSNIHPRSEWLARLDAVKIIAEKENTKLIIANWTPRTWLKDIKKENNKNLRRCKACWQHRLERTQKKTLELGIRKFSTTLLSSHYQNKEEIDRIGKGLNYKGLLFVILKDTDLVIHTKGFYKQNYCGCCFSLADRYRNNI